MYVEPFSTSLCGKEPSRTFCVKSVLLAYIFICSFSLRTAVFSWTHCSVLCVTAQFEVKGVIKRWGDRCLYEAHSSPGNKEGRFFSPLYPQNYPPDTNCVYILHGLEKEKVKVIFKNIQLENIDGR